MFGVHERATFLLLPNCVAPDHARLGRIVTNIYAPGGDFAPHEPKKPFLLGHGSEPLIQRKARGIFKHEKYNSIRGQLSYLLSIDFSRGSTDDVHWSTGELATRTLLDHETYLRKLERNRDVQDFIRAAWYPENKKDKKDVFLIVGVKEWTDANVTARSTHGHTVRGKGTVPVGAAANLPTEALDVGGEIENTDKKQVSNAGVYEGDAVFAVQYRRIKKPSGTKLTLDDAKRLGPSTFSGEDGFEDDPTTLKPRSGVQVWRIPESGEEKVSSDTSNSLTPDTESKGRQKLDRAVSTVHSPGTGAATETTKAPILNLELDDQLDEDYLEHGDEEYGRIDLGDDDILFTRHSEGDEM